MEIRDFLKSNIVVLDGGTGTLLQKAGLKPGEATELWNISHPEVITGVHKSYFDAGSNIVATNTFGASSLKYSSEELSRIVSAAMANAKAARLASQTPQEKFIAIDIGPCGRLLKPFGDLDFEEAVSAFKETIRLGAENGADLVLIETMNDCYETKAAVVAAKEVCDLPIFVSNAYSENGRLMTGASPAAMVAMLEGLGVTALGVNCSFGPKQLAPIVREYLAAASIPVLLEPNAGLPVCMDGCTVFPVGPEELAEDVAMLVKEGVRIVGGCCGTTPEHIAAIVNAIKGLSPVEIAPKRRTVVSSGVRDVAFGERPLLIGERINPTGKKRLKQALHEHDISYILEEGLKQQENGAHILDVNVGLPDIDECEMLVSAVTELQAVIDLPLQIDTSNPQAMEQALRRYNGKPMVNSVNGKAESMDAIFPLVKKYGGVVVALTLDESGIPNTAAGRVDIAKRILARAAEYGISPNDIVFDTLALTISADTTAANATLESLKIIREQLGCHTSLGVSNISFGLPSRELINGVFFAMALQNGLSAAIMNPASFEMKKAYTAFCTLRGLDPNCLSFIDFASQVPAAVAPAASVPSVVGETPVAESNSALQHAILKGLKEQAALATAEALSRGASPLDVVNTEVIPALDEVGKGFEEKRLYLPQLLMSAEAAKAAFEKVKGAVLATAVSRESRGLVVLATVKGDIHDIGKNIVKLLLENYDFTVVDLGRDVDPEVVLEAVVEKHAPIVGLSALMTTTVPAMEETIRLLKDKAPWCKTVVGGAVLTQEYADKIGADAYSKDAMETVRYALKSI